ncbi:serine--tRNA ligase [Hydrogenibacillus sp. N12]|uniref:serine--tRNA ligase n=1 Tax=Hydrogenibacillus sp. N12 TaxID=2866627 RepID=UPI001C7D6A1E|nr:serine--tRNA ligase [Hydrogenibacillus sp. N12]QZA33035.1 serine--tRNA ligase [Hydrogenibacillus sp. N12]
MLDIQFIRENVDAVKEAARMKGIDVDIDRLIHVDNERRSLIQAVERLKHERNENSKRVKSLTGEEKTTLIERTRAIGEEIKTLEARLDAVLAEWRALMLRVPNVPSPDTPIGTSEEDNVEIRRVGTPPAFSFPPKNHIELMTLHGMVDVERGVKVAGSRSYYLMGDGLRLHLAVQRLALDLLAERGFTPMAVPVLVNGFALEGTGYFPLGEEQAYHCETDDKYLIGTAEVSLAAFHYDEILREEELPKRYVGVSECFRREVGSAGRDTFGLYRVHQFSKVEQVIIGPNDEAMSRRLHDELLENAELILQRLELPYRVVQVCTGEMGQGQVRKHDIETWMPSRGGYGETHSCSTFHDFQARRLKLRYRKADGSLAYCHTLNNTAIASPRILIALVENHQQEDGSIRIPEALRPYMGGRSFIGR